MDPFDVTQLSPGSTLYGGRYRILEFLARGGMGYVYKAIDETSNLEVALKQALFTEDDQRHWFENEAKNLKELNHPSLPQFIDCFVESRGYFLVMEYLSGLDIDKLITYTGPLHQGMIFPWTKQLLELLIYLHSQSPPIVHRDIKPKNIKLRSGKIFLLDFGLSKSGGITVVHGESRGYSSPEQARGLTTDNRSDLYSLGATIYYLLSGLDPPDADKKRYWAKENNQSDPLRSLHLVSPSVSEDLARAIHKAMAVEPRDRFPTAGAMLQDITAAFADENRKQTIQVRQPPAENVTHTIAQEYFLSRVPEMCKRWSSWASSQSNAVSQKRYPEVCYTDLMDFVSFLKIWWPDRSDKLFAVSVEDIRAFWRHLHGANSDDESLIRFKISLLSTLYEFLATAARHVHVPLIISNPAAAFIGNVAPIQVSFTDVFGKDPCTLYDLSKHPRLYGMNLMKCLRQAGFNTRNTSETVPVEFANWIMENRKKLEEPPMDQANESGSKVPRKAVGRSTSPPRPGKRGVTRVIRKAPIPEEELTPEEQEARHEGKTVWQVARLENRTYGEVVFHLLNENDSWDKEILKPRGMRGSQSTFWRKDMNVVVKFHIGTQPAETHYSLQSHIIVERPPNDLEKLQAPLNFFAEDGDSLRLYYE